MNSAERLLNIYDKLVSNQPDHSMINVWVYVFNLQLSDSDVEDSVINCLIALRQQIDNTAKKLVEDRDVPNDLLHPGYKNLRNISSPTYLNQSWSSMRSAIQAPENRQSFLWSSFILKDLNEKEISDEDIQDLLSEISNFEELLAATEMSSTLRDFLEQQIASIRSSLQVAKILGTNPVKESIEKFAGSYAINRDMLDDEVKQSSDKTKSVFSKFGNIIKKTANFADNADKLLKLGEHIKNGYKAVEPLMLDLFK
jgi:hypothetical protein